jgi:hypothetical protein
MPTGFRTANQIINESLASVRDFDRKYYNEAAMYFDRGYREFKLFNDSSFKESWETITAINTVNYPKDAIRLLSVGVVSDGEMFTFTRSDDMVAPITSPIDSFLDSDRGEDDTLRRVPQIGYGAKSVNVEYYYFDDRKKRRIVLGRAAVDVSRFAARGEVLVRYVANEVDNLDALHIPDDASNLLIAYIEYKLVESRPDKYDRGYMAEKKQNYREEVRRYEALELPSLQDMIDVIYETSGQTPRRV